MKRIVALCLALFATTLTACGEDPELQMFVAEGDEGSIVGGSNYSGMPAVGALYYNGRMHCTGTLISANKVLTAAHCVSGYSASGMTYRLGPNAESPSNTYRVSSMRAHPSYSASQLTNDIAYVILSTSVPSSVATPMQVMAANSLNSTYVGKQVFFVGYGTNNGYSQTGYGIKRAVWIPLSKVNATTFEYRSTTKNTCNGDSGGPGFVQTSTGGYLIAGVTSWGDRYCVQYGVDTRADTYRTFLGI